MATKPLYIDVHVLQTVPPNNMNRDDTGSPKTARFGGVTRSRVSSQAWKKATRDAFATLLDEDDLGQRTVHAVDLIAGEIRAIAPDLDDEKAHELAGAALGATGVKVNKDKGYVTGYLLFISPRQAQRLAGLAVDAFGRGVAVDKKEARAILDIKAHPVLNAIDIALFGRMVADAPDLNVDASVQVAHAIGVGRAEPEFDYFTAMDDRAPEDNAGAGMIGTVEFTSETLYRYATVDVMHLAENLGSVAAARRAVETFLRAFVLSMPTGKQNTFANRTLPAGIVVQLRDTQPVSLVTAFETPVAAHDGRSQAAVACEALVKQERLIDEAFGVTPVETHAVCAAPGTGCLAELATSGAAESLDDLVTSVGERTIDYLDASGFVDEE